MKITTIAILLSLCALPLAHAGVTVTPTSTGIQIVGDGETLKFTMSYPTLSTSDKKKTYSNKGVEVKDGNTAVLKFEGGGELDIAFDPSGTITMKGENLPPDVSSLSTRMQISQSFKVGGTYKFGDKEAKPFPEEKPEKPHLFQGNADTFTVRSGDGKGVTITVPKYAYQEVTDMREWNTNAYGWMTLANFTPEAAVTFKIEDAGAAPAPAGDAASTNAAPATP